MFTPDLLFEMALAAQSELDGKSKERDRASIVRRRDDAMNTALWMEQHSIPVASSIGPFGNIDLQPGDRICIPTGITIGGPGGPEVVGHGFDAEVCGVDAGCVIDLDGKIILRNQRVIWVGESDDHCYWTEASKIKIA